MIRQRTDERKHEDNLINYGKYRVVSTLPLRNAGRSFHLYQRN